MHNARPNALVWLLLLVLALIWGSSFILMKRGLFHEGEPVLTAYQLATSRLAIAWLALMPLMLRHMHLLRSHWKPLLGSAVFGNGLPAILFATAQTRIDSSLSGMLNGLTPLMTLLAGLLFFGLRFRGVHLLGVALGLVGAAGLILSRADDGLPTWTIHALLPVIGTVCYGLSGNIVKHYLYGLPPAAISALALTFVGPLCVGLAIHSGLPATLAEHPHAWRAMGHVALLAVLASALALVLWNVLLQHTTALWASSVTYLMPIVAIGWGVLDGERISLGQLVMIAVVLGGVYLVSVAERRG
jgi:drug/metabolite transporter (DMT)-like permease